MERTIAVIVLSLAAACGTGEFPQNGSLGQTRSSEDVTSNGRSLNGRSLNGRSLNGRSLNGRSLNGVSLGAISMSSGSLNNLAIEGSQLTAVNARGAKLTGAQLAGATLSGVLDDGSALPLRIDNVVQGAGDNSDVWFYDISYQSGATASARSSVCTDENGNPSMAIPLAGSWDQSAGTSTGGDWSPNSATFTLGCHAGGATAKCVELGYKPWQTVNGVSMRSYHETCTRLIRADYCGNGVSWTQDGRTIDLYDDMSINTDTDKTWIFEAEWTPDGANCVSMIRVFNLANTIGILDQCILGKLNLFCGNPNDMKGSTMLMNRYHDLDLFGISL